MRYAMAMDTSLCVGCADCVVACQTENNVPEGYCRDWIVENVDGTYPLLDLEIRSERCNHCEDTPCVRTCPTGASHVIEGGIVKVTHEECIGCGACIESCPYDARYFHPDGYVDKCTFCDHRVAAGDTTACVSVCPTHALTFGDLHDSESEISKLLATRKYKVLAEEAGTKPQLYFLT
ncbi:MAG: 4Fe-4S dicluster domain-containing protein [Flavobacteriales bacterium]|nr:4Fe-4S dicluster domain-containing protein [Flavobacteriales bacterium]